jgi:defect-in-organelle-trafficking protein DotC
MRTKLLSTVAIATLLAFAPAAVHSQQAEQGAATKPVAAFGGQKAAAAADHGPPAMESLQSIVPSKTVTEGLPEIRSGALREAALSLGARGGLSRKSFEINAMLARTEKHLDQIFSFDQMMIAGPSQSVVVPPVVTESQIAFALSPDGQSASQADAVFRMTRNAHITSAAPNWRSYLERAWSLPDLPPDALRPKDDTEKSAWKAWVAEGWNRGLQQAVEIFLDDLSRLERDFVGMARYRVLLSQGLVETPAVALANRGVTGGGNTMKVGDRVVRITKPSRLNERSDEWLPAPESRGPIGPLPGTRP